MSWFAWEEGKRPFQEEDEGTSQHHQFVSKLCSKTSCKWTMKPLFYKGCLLKKHSFCAQATRCPTGSGLLPLLRDTAQPWHIQGSKECGAVPASQVLPAWGSLQDGFLGTVLSVILMDTSSMGGRNAPLSNGSVDNRDHWKGGNQNMGRGHHECPLVPYYVGDRLVHNTLSGDYSK